MLSVKPPPCNIFAKYGVAAKSEGTFEGVLERIKETRELSVEMWIKYHVTSRYFEKMFLITGGDEMDLDYFEDMSCSMQISCVNLLLHILNSYYASFFAYHYSNEHILFNYLRMQPMPQPTLTELRSD